MLSNVVGYLRSFVGKETALRTVHVTSGKYYFDTFDRTFFRLPPVQVGAHSLTQGRQSLTGSSCSDSTALAWLGPGAWAWGRARPWRGLDSGSAPRTTSRPNSDFPAELWLMGFARPHSLSLGTCLTLSE